MLDTLPCPTCGRPVLTTSAERSAAYPFCSSRCRERDLGAWFAGRYTIAGADLDHIDRNARSVDRTQE